MALEILPYVVAVLVDEGHGAYEHLGALETLCVTLPYADPDVLIAVDKVDCLATRLPAMVSATGADQGDMPVLAAQAIAGVVEHLPQWAKNFAEHGAIQALRDRLIAVDNVDLAQECLRALNLICMECPAGRVPPPQRCRRSPPACREWRSTSSPSSARTATTRTCPLPKAMKAGPALCKIRPAAI